MIYETLVRDFDEAQTFQDLIINQLDYLEFMGYNAIELVPVNEFEGNLSWGYNSNFRFAVDKFWHGSQTCELVNKCHGLGIAVIVDVVPNHSFGTDPHGAFVPRSRRFCCQRQPLVQQNRQAPIQPWVRF